jgi:aminoglycoside 6'-N-acetyltransferase
MNHQNIHLRPATIDDLPLLLKWDEEPHVIESDPNDDWQWETELLRSPEWREQLVAEINERPIGFVQIIDPALEEDHYWGDVPNNLRAIDIWLGNAEDLGKGYGTEIMKQAINICFSTKFYPV